MTESPLSRDEILNRSAARIARKARRIIAEGREGMSYRKARESMASKTRDQFRDAGITLKDIVERGVEKGWIAKQGEPGPTPPGTQHTPGRIIPGPVEPPTDEEAVHLFQNRTGSCGCKVIEDFDGERIRVHCERHCARVRNGDWQTCQGC